jgi:hypothetical protein
VGVIALAMGKGIELEEGGGIIDAGEFLGVMG